MRLLTTKLQRQGWSVSRTGKGHYRFASPDGQLVFTSGTSSDWRSIHNFRRDLRRAGAVL